ncbi:MAG: MerR family transcriptional regulator [Cyclobacteriaceae bacterium]
MRTYSVSEVERLTGIRSHSLRMWERRYGFLSADRTSTNIRAYSEAQVKKLLNVSILLRNGYKLSKIDKMPDQVMLDSVSEILASPIEKKDDEVQGLLLGMVELDERKISAIIEKKISSAGMLPTIVELVFPFLSHVGSLWRINQASPANEHFVSSLIRRKLLTAIDSIPNPIEPAKKILLFLPEGEDHELGLIIADFIAKDLGWKTFYLGTNVPSENIKNILSQISPDLVFSIMIIPRVPEQDSMLLASIEESQIPYACSGNKEVISNFAEHIEYLSSPQDLIGLLKSF